MSFFTDFTPLMGTLFAAKKLHRVLLWGTLRAPLSYFDTTPSGRILARFSKDIDILDSILPRNVSAVYYFSFEVLSINLN